MAKKIIYLFLILFIAAICFSPRLSLGYLPSTQRSVDIRVEDILIFLGIIFVVIYFIASGRISFKKPPLFWPIVAWILFGFLSILVNFLIFSGNSAITFFYFLKEIEFFCIFFLVFYCVKEIRDSEKLIKYWIIFYLVNIVWLIYVFLNKVSWSTYYGPDIFAEPKGPFPSGGFFLMVFIFLFNLFLFYYSKLKISKTKKICLFILCIAPIFGVFSSGSYTAIAGFLLSIILSLLIYFSHKINIIRVFKVLLMVFLATIITFQLLYMFNLAGKISKTKLLFEYGSSNPVSRIGILKHNFSKIFESSPINLFLGFGIVGESHSQYMRVFLERGLIGLLIFGWLITSILVISWRGMRDKNNFYGRGLSAGLFIATISMLVMAIPNDVFSVVKLDEVYWFFTALTLFYLYKINKMNSYDNEITKK